MKELSIEEKAKAYDEAIERAKVKLTNEVAEDIFPELAESEDEKIRKELLAVIDDLILPDKQKERFVAWLEEQAEHSNFRNKIQIGDKVTRNEDGVLVNLSQLNRVAKKDEKQGEQKPADNSNYLLSWSENEEKMLQCLEGIVKDYWAKAEQEKNELKIREASNVSFFLKTIHKQPLCWIKCSDRLPNKDGIYLVVTDGMHNDVYDMARYDSIEGWHKASEIIYWMPIPQLNDKSIIEQKPSEWSEEDEEQLQHTIAAIQWYAGGTDIIDWIKSLKDRVQLQPKKEWSEEDRNKIADYLYCLNVGFTQIAAKQRAKDICDLLRPQTTWKPSDEQMKALYEETQKSDRIRDERIVSLYADLKKLKE